MANAQADWAVFRNAILDTVVPEASSARLPEVLDEGSETEADDESSLISITQRRHLFFDERLTVFVVLQTARASEGLLKESLPRLQIRLDVHAIDNSRAQSVQPESEDDAEPERELIFSDHIKNDQDPFIAVNASKEADAHDDTSVLVIWELEVTLHRPRLRIPNPAVTFTASASSIPAKRTDKTTDEDDYLPSLVPAPTNVLEGLKAIPALQDCAPYLPGSRIESVLPGPPVDPQTLHIRHQPVKHFPISPAVSARIRCSPMATSSPRLAAVASLDFEVTPFASFDVQLDRANVSLASDGQIDNLSPLAMPITCRPRDIVTFLYKVHPPAQRGGVPPFVPPNAAGLLDIIFEATLQISSKCKPTVTMRWRSNVDFSSSDPHFGSSSQPLQRPDPASRLPSALDNSTATSASKRPPSPRIDGRPISTTSLPHFAGGLTISFTVPPTVSLGEIFPFTLLLTNRTARPLKLALIPIPRRPPGSNLPPRRHAPKPSASSTLDRRHTSAKRPGGNAMDVAPAVMDENIIHALQKSSINSTTDTDLVPVSADVRVGPLGVGSCHEVHIKMLGLRVGVLRLEAVRVLDLAREAEIRDRNRDREATGGGGGSGMFDIAGDCLPEVVVVDREGMTGKRMGLGRGEVAELQQQQQQQPPEEGLHDGGTKRREEKKRRPSKQEARRVSRQ